MKSQGMWWKLVGERGTWVSEHRVSLNCLLYANEIPACCWLLHYINSRFHLKPGTCRMNGIKGTDGWLQGTQSSSLYCTKLHLVSKGVTGTIPVHWVSLQNALSAPLVLHMKSNNPLRWITRWERELREKNVNMYFILMAGFLFYKVCHHSKLFFVLFAWRSLQANTSHMLLSRNKSSCIFFVF